MVRSNWLPAVVILCYPWTAAVARAQEPKPGEPIEYQPFFPDKWKEFKHPTMMYPWEGKRVVLLTNRNDFDGKTMAVFLRRLDAGWELYEDLIGKKPGPFRQHGGKPTIAAVPEAKFTCGMGCGYHALTGIEVAGFYKDFFGGPGDYNLVGKDPEVFAHYYFYEMGRNYYLFGDRFSRYSTAFAVTMRYVCMDTLQCKDPDQQTRQWIERWEEQWSKEAVSWAEAFPEFGAKKQIELKDIDGKPFKFSDMSAMFTSGFLHLRKLHGGNAWVKRFYRHLMECPVSPASEPDGIAGQTLNYLIAASLAAGKDLTPQFVDRWRFPVSPLLARSLGHVEWARQGLTAEAVYASLPEDQVPTAIYVRRPGYLTAERRKANLLAGGTFEEKSRGNWSARTRPVNKDGVYQSRHSAKEGKQSLAIRCLEEDDAVYAQKVTVVPKTRYLLSGWIKTKGVEVVQKGGTVGANLSLGGGWDRTESITGDADWTYVVLVFDSGKQTEVEVCARLGHFGSTAKGEAWFDDLVLVEIGKAPPSK